MLVAEMLGLPYRIEYDTKIQVKSKWRDEWIDIRKEEIPLYEKYLYEVREIQISRKSYVSAYEMAIKTKSLM